MRIVRTLTELDAADRGASAAIGNFDGVHLGHQAVIDQARGDAPLGVVTFEPHPREVFAPDSPPFRLTSRETRANRLRKLGVERLYELPFQEIAPLSAEAFARDVLAGALGLSRAVVGADFRFGKGRTGTAEQLAELGRANGFEVVIAPLVRFEAGEVSSTRIREALSEGRPRDAARMLGHAHRVDGAVLHGEKRGRALGYPTANMSLDGLHLPKFGVYAVRADVLTGPFAGSYEGVASIGVRPMFGVNTPNLETHLFDFDGDLYDEHLSVALIEFLRPEVRYDGVPALVSQMDADSVEARKVLE